MWFLSNFCIFAESELFSNWSSWELRSDLPTATQPRVCSYELFFKRINLIYKYQVWGLSSISEWYDQISTSLPISFVWNCTRKYWIFSEVSRALGMDCPSIRPVSEKFFLDFLFGSMLYFSFFNLSPGRILDHNRSERRSNDFIVRCLIDTQGIRSHNCHPPDCLNHTGLHSDFRPHERTFHHHFCFPKDGVATANLLHNEPKFW